MAIQSKTLLRKNTKTVKIVTKNREGANMLWRKSTKNIRKLEAEVKELYKQIKKLESQNQQLSGQVTIYKSARDFMNLLFYKIPTCVLITDDKGRIMKANQHMQDLIETRESALVGKYTVEICTRVDELIKTQNKAFEKKTLKENVINFESCLLHRNGTEVPISSDITFVQDETGKTLGAVAVVHPRG
jgi:PAS domain S-box-containing protein